MRLLTVLALGAAGLAGGPPPSTADRLPLRLLAGRPVIAVTIDGRGPFDFVFDTGAAGTVLNGDLADELGLASTGKARVGDPAGGSGMEVDRHVLPSLEVAGVRVTSLNVVSWRDERMMAALGGARGVLGLPALSGSLVTFDFGQNVIVIEPGRLSDGDGSSPYASPRPIPSVEVRVAGQTLEGHIDTGNAGGVSLPAKLRDQLTFAGPLQAGRARTASGEFEILTGELAGEVHVLGQTIRNPRVQITERFPWVNIGRAALSGFALTVDPANRRIRMTPSPTGGTGAGR